MIKLRPSNLFQAKALLLPLLTLLVACRVDNSSITLTPQNNIDDLATTSMMSIPTRELVTIKATTSPTMEPTPILDYIPVPTMLPEEAELADLKMIELYETNGNCQLPCFWGFSPGVTEWATAETLLSTLTNHIFIPENESDSSFVVSVNLFNAGSNYYREQTYVVKDEIIEKINAEINGSSPVFDLYKLAAILREHGRPSEIYLSTYATSIQGELPFNLVLFYPDDVMLLKYYANAHIVEIDGVSTVEGCILNESMSRLALWPPDAALSFAEAVETTKGMSPSEGYFYHSLEDVTEMDIEMFYQTYLDPNTEICIQTPAEIWEDY